MSQHTFSFVDNATEHTLFVDGEWVGKTAANSQEEAVDRLREALYGAYDRVSWRPSLTKPPEEWDSLSAIPF